MPVTFIADLHLHTCLSPCAELEMTPRMIVEQAASRGINILAVSDHNSVENAEVTGRLGKDKGITVLPGLEITTAEEVHVLGIFGDIDAALGMQDIVYKHLQPGTNDEEKFGMQVIVNEDDEVLGFNERLLIGATTLSVRQVVDHVHSLGGLAIASHIDREVFGIIGQLGFIPPGLDFNALEISWRLSPDDARSRFSEYANTPWIFSSDAHRLEEIGKKTTGFYMDHATFEELCLAIAGKEGRKIIHGDEGTS